MKKVSIFLALFLGLALILSGPAAADQFISIATGGTGGVYYPVGGGMAELINQHVEGVNATAEVTGASTENVRLLQAGEVELGLVQNDITFYAKTGTEMFEDEELGNLRGVAVLYPEIIQIVTLEGAGIDSVYDFAGKTIAVGAPGSGTEANARQIIEAHGLTYEDMTVDYLSFAEAVDQLRDGHVDAAFLTAGIPTGALMDLAATHDPKILSIDEDVAAQIMEDFPFYTEAVIPGGTYDGLDEDVNTVTVLAMIVTSAALDSDTVYNMTAAIFDNLDYLYEIHERARDITVEAAQDGMPIELHRGAARYFDQ